LFTYRTNSARKISLQCKTPYVNFRYKVQNFFSTHKAYAMQFYSSAIHIKTTSNTDIINISPQVEDIVSRQNILNGMVLLFIAGSTAALTTIEYERGVVNDLRRAIELMAPEGITYEHDARWGDGNGYAHVRAAILGPSLTIPLRGGQLLLGTWQQIVLCDFDNRPRTREIIMQLQGIA
jgi:secondary thiamine-phosphate synthase enzyme